MGKVYKTLEERGLIKQVTHPQPLAERLEQPLTVYAGFDATADSLHVGHLLPVMMLSHLQRAGHRPIVVIGGGTTMIGDPSGKTELRQMLDRETIEENARKLTEQLSRFICLDEGKGLVLDNSQWLADLNYIEFLREIGVHFSVNRMLTYDCFKSRLERGLSFIEFNYMLLQSYDFLVLFREHECCLQVGGDDQWSNIISGADLVRRVEQGEAFGMTTPLLERADGSKMGKTEEGAVWLDADKLPVYDFFQFWRNTDDREVARFLRLYTFMPLAEIDRLTAGSGTELNQAKEVLALEVTSLVHGRQEAEKARDGAWALFGGGGRQEAVPASEVEKARLEQGVPLLELLEECGLISSKSQGRRLVEQGGIYVNEQRVQDWEMVVKEDDLQDGALNIRKGKKVHHRITSR